MTNPLRRRTTLAALAALGVGVLLTATASTTWAASSGVPATAATGATVAADSPTPTTGSDGSKVVVSGDTVTLTLDTAKVRAMCAKVPELRKRIDATVTRIQGDSDVDGSAAALSQRAAEARAAGRDAAAARLEARADRRTARVGDLQRVTDRLAKAQEAVCVPLAEQLGAGS